jgi:dimethylaniline monooxygenase (N-oxide forming)
MPSDALTDTVEALVVGAGPSGLVSLKYLLEYGPPLGLVSRSAIAAGTGVLGVEMEAEIGGTFRYVIFTSKA